mgnify:CR=1 FL=1
MLKRLAILLTLIPALALGGEVKLKITGKGGVSGTGNLINKVLEGGDKYVQLNFSLEVAGGGKVTVEQESLYDKFGRPKRKLQTVTNPDGSFQSMVATFDSEGVDVRIRADGNSGSGRVEAPKGHVINAKPEFWFIRDKVAPGGKSTYHRFDLATQKWVKTTAKYEGKRTIKVGGTVVSTHLVIYDQVKAYVDDKGDPFKIEMLDSGLTLERVD